MKGGIASAQREQVRFDGEEKRSHNNAPRGGGGERFYNNTSDGRKAEASTTVQFANILAQNQ